MVEVIETHRKDPLEEYAKWNDLDVNENANRYMGPTGFFSYLLENYMNSTLLELMPKPVLKAHLDGYIYVHKLPYSLYIPYCTGHSIARVLEKGLKTPTIISRPARHFDTYVDHVANYLITLQHYFTGAQAFSSVEWYAGPFIRKDKLSYDQVKQQIQRLIFNLNYPTRVGMQTPFTNFTTTLDAPRKMLEGDYAIYDGKKIDPLGEYYEEAKTFILALTDILYHGDMYGQPFTFPIPTLMVTAKMIWEEPEVFEAIFKTAAHRGSFYWLNTKIVDPDASFAMCLHESERLIIKDGNTLHVSTIGEVFKKYSGELEVVDPDGAEWYKPKKELAVLTYDFEKKTLTWHSIRRFLVKKSRRAVRITLSDGRVFLVTPDHPILVYNKYKNSIELRKAKSFLGIKKLTMFKIPIIMHEVPGEYVKLK
ncbi:MAG: ribonucleoside-triphosphate reductase, partial [Staphylothermus sp.]|nr:ribonucleoside-triphosphate reductase [Staphylothermus sp.]